MIKNWHHDSNHKNNNKAIYKSKLYKSKSVITEAEKQRALNGVNLSSNICGVNGEKRPF